VAGKREDYCCAKRPTCDERTSGRQTAYTWKRVLDEGGIDALRSMPGRGRPARLDEQQFQALGRVLVGNPTDHGFGTELWTLKRVGALIAANAGPAVDLKALHAKIGQLTLENVFLEGALGKAGLLSVRR
jgi:transposase